MNILYVGGVYPVELSLFKEAQGNPNINLVMCGAGDSAPGVLSLCDYKTAITRDAVDRLKESLKPDLVLFRTWCVTTEKLVGPGEILWAQEIFQTNDGGVSTGDNTIRKGSWHIAYQSKPRAIQNSGYWLPYCVSKHWGRIEGVTKTIPVMVATSMPGGGPATKMKSMKILVEPVVAWNSSMVKIFPGYNGFKSSYLQQCISPSFSVINSVPNICKAKIYISPTSIWYDEDCVSYKTVEAMACGVLTLTNNYIGMEDVFGKDGENLIYANSPEESLDKVRYYLDHDKEREEIAQRGYEFVHREYGWESNFERLIKELSSVS